MKRIHETFTDEEFEQLESVKNGRTWHDAILEEFTADNGLTELVEEWREKAEDWGHNPELGYDVDSHSPGVGYLKCAEELEELLNE